MTAKHPTSNIAIFTINQNGRLAYYGDRQEKTIEKSEYKIAFFKAYQTSGSGDSGCPWSTTIDVDTIEEDYDAPSTSKKRQKIQEKRYVQIGIQSTSIVRASCEKFVKPFSCLQKTTKLTEDKVEWIKRMYPT